MVDKDTFNRSKEWIIKVTDSSHSITSFKPLLGATSSSVYEVIVDDKEYVLRLYTSKAWNKAEPDLALHEGTALGVAYNNRFIKTPGLIAIDEDGKQCGYPAVFMTKVSGDVLLFPENRESWLSQLAQTLCAIHSIGSVDFAWAYYPYHTIVTLQAPAWSEQVDVWQKAIDYVRGYQPNDPVTFLHRDYHPMNVLWDGGKVSGVVDWVNACLGPCGVDVGHCRLNLALLYNVEVADQFLLEYENVAGDSFSYQPYWDLRMIFEFLPGPPIVYQGWVDVGVTGLTDQLMKERYEAYLLSVWNRI